MNTGRRGFFKVIGAVVGGLVASKVKAKERELAQTYHEKFKTHSLKPRQTTPQQWEAKIPQSGCYALTGRYHGPIISG